jgi:hypothetical protein
VVNLVDSFTFKALVNILWRIEQNAYSSEKDRGSISDEPPSFMASLLTHRAETSNLWSGFRSCCPEKY